MPIHIGYARRRKTRKRHNTICVGHHYTEASIHNINKTCALLQTSVYRCLSFFSIGHCVVCPSSLYGFWLLLWYLLVIVLSVLRFTDSDYPFGIFKLFYNGELLSINNEFHYLSSMFHAVYAVKLNIYVFI